MKTCTKNRFPFSMRTRILTMLFVFILHSPAEDVNSVPAVLRPGSMAIEPVSRSVSQATCINNAVLWLVQQQRADGRWPGDDLSSTALSVLAVSIGSGPGWGVNPVFEKSVLSGYRALLGSLRSDGSPAIVSDDGIDDPISVLALCQISGLFPAEEDASIILAAVDRIASEQSADGTWGGANAHDRAVSSEMETYSNWCTLALVAANAYGLDSETISVALDRIPSSSFRCGMSTSDPEQAFLSCYLAGFGVNQSVPRFRGDIRSICATQRIISQGYRENDGFVHDIGFWDTNAWAGASSAQTNAIDFADSAEEKVDEELLNRIKNTALNVLILCAEGYFRTLPASSFQRRSKRESQLDCPTNIVDRSEKRSVTTMVSSPAKTSAKPKDVQLTIRPKLHQTQSSDSVVHENATPPKDGK